MTLAHRLLARALALLVALGASALMMAGPALASSFSYKCVGDPSYGCVQGTITVRRDVTSWSLTVKDNRADGYGVYAKVVIDRDNLTDPVFRSQNVGPAGAARDFYGGPVQYSYTRGARIELCQDIPSWPDTCKTAHYEAEVN